MIYRALLFSFTVMILVISLTPFNAYAQQSYSVTSTEIIVFRDGLAQVKQILNVNETAVSISLPLLSPSIINVLVLDQENIPLSYEITPPNIDIFTLGTSNVTLEYVTPDLTRKEGNVWTFQVNTLYDANITLPDQSNIIYLNDLPLSITSRDSKTFLTVPPGLWEISYTLLIVPSPTPTTTTPIPTPSPTPTPTPTPTPSPTPIPIEYLAAIVVVVVIGVLFFLKIRKSKIKELELRPEDRAVLQFIAEKGGKVLESELRQKFLLPRTSVWRLARRLERMGYIQISKVGIQNEIMLVKKP